jgi:hypothetical protein
MATTIDAGCIYASLDYLINSFELLQNIARNGTGDDQLSDYAWWIENLVDKLDGERIAFNDILYRIFSGKPPTKRSQWESQETASAVKRALGPRYGRFRVIIARMVNHIHKLAGLGQVDNAEVTSN